MTYDPPSLLELSARCIKITRVTYRKSDLPANLFNYLALAQRCVNPKCKGVYFDARIEHIKFVDFCGKYRLPLLQYLCSPSCTSRPTYVSSSSSSEAEVSDDDEQVAASKLKRVLLG
ncbi:leucine-rich repeat-containing protein 58-like [Tachypleus tridentatus]|uniref:leucine-rich repeat-containing protein 58-like n=1 Tax=Tachypleus tridentatus TaxID=6853 RepID=UPI003FD1B363